MNRITNVEKDSIAHEMGIEKGDILVSINGEEIKDVFDYRYMVADEYLELLIIKPDGEEWLLEIEKDESEPLGIEFDTGLMDNAKTCSNKCIFCFIDQLPKGMRDTLYFKDDDSRLSFLQGNYVTLTNMKEQELDRIIYYHLSPINISVHATDLDVRRFMLKNSNSDKLMHYIKKLYDAGIEMNFQIVLCKDVNDKAILDKSIKELGMFMGKGRSLSVVPAGITQFREGLYDIKSFDSEECAEIIAQVEGWQKWFIKNHNTRFVFAADEFYIKAGIAIPRYRSYEDFPQIENGVGMMSSFMEEVNQGLKSARHPRNAKNVSVATGEAAYNYVKQAADKITNKYDNIKIMVYKIENKFFGGHITVSGLLTGTDIFNSLKHEALGESLLIPSNALRKDDTVLLDDMDIKELEQKLGVKVTAVKTNGYDFVSNIIDE